MVVKEYYRQFFYQPVGANATWMDVIVPWCPKVIGWKRIKTLTAPLSCIQNHALQQKKKRRKKKTSWSRQSRRKHFSPLWSIKRKNNKKEVDGGKISNKILVKAIKRLVTSSSKTKHFSICWTDQIAQESTKTTTTTVSSKRRFFERVDPSVGGVG